MDPEWITDTRTTLGGTADLRTKPADPGRGWAQGHTLAQTQARTLAQALDPGPGPGSYRKL